MKFLKISIIFALLLTSCARNLSSSNYTSSSTSGVVLQGTVVSAREVTISEADRLNGNSTGAIGGGLAGGVAGSTIGKGDGAVLATVGGVIIGAVAGAVIQDQLGRNDGIEYIIKIQRKDSSAYAPKEVKYKNSKKYTSNDDYTTDVISVVQGKDTIFAPGQKVYIIYADDRPRVIARD